MWFEEPRSNIVDEKFPIGRSPFLRLVPCDPVKTDAMTSDEIEFFPKIRQRRLRIDSRNEPANAEELCRAAPKWVVVRIQAESFVTKETAEIEKITGATAQVENVKWRRAVEPQILDVLDVDADPVRCVFVGVDSSRVGPVRIMFAQPFQFRLINRAENPLRAHGMSPAADVLPQALRSVEGKELLDLTRKSHRETMQRTAEGTRLEQELFERTTMA